MELQRRLIRMPGSEDSTPTWRPIGPREQLGAAIGSLLAPTVAALTRLRHARMFHPVGHTFAGHAVGVAGPFEALGRELTGRVLARMSAALWRSGWEHLDVLGLALRFRRGPGSELDERAAPGDQDLLTATIRSPFTMLASPFFTNAHDFMDNRYWAVSPFEHAKVGRVELRLVPITTPYHDPRRASRAERLLAAVDDGRAGFWLQARRTLTLRWVTCARVQLDRLIVLDQARLAFDPFRGRLRPVGVVHAIRRPVYAAGQQARPRIST